MWHFAWCQLQEVSVGETIVRRYSPASIDQSQIIINIFSSENPRVAIVSEPGVTKCGRLRLQLHNVPVPPPSSSSSADQGVGGASERRRREVETTMTFGDTEIRVGALDVATGNCVRACVEFLGSVWRERVDCTAGRLTAVFPDSPS